MNNSKLYSSSINSNLSSSRNFTSPPFQEGAIIRTVPVHCVFAVHKPNNKLPIHKQTSIQSWVLVCLLLDKLFLKKPTATGCFFVCLILRRG